MQFIIGCLNSIPNVSDIEIIVVDDGSDIDVQQACGRFPGFERVQFVRQQHQGVLAARRYGCEIAEGEYVWFVDSDDEVKTIPYIPRADLIRFRQEYGWMCVGDKIYRREVALKAFDEIGDLKLKQCEDGIFYLAALKHASSVVESDESIYTYVHRGDSASMRFNPDAISERELLVDWRVKIENCAGRNLFSKEAFVTIVCSLCKWHLTWSELKGFCHSLMESRLLADGKDAILEDSYARKMLFSVRHPIMIFIYRFLRFKIPHFSACAKCCLC